MIKSLIQDGLGRGHIATVTHTGQLVVGSYAFDSVKQLTLDTAAAGYTFFKPKSGQQFVLTGVILTADKNVSTDCIVNVYEATTEDSATIETSIFQFEILKNGDRQLTGLNVLINEGKFLTAKTDDDDVYATLMGYYIPKVV